MAKKGQKLRKRGGGEGFLCACGSHAWARMTRGRVTVVDPEDINLLRSSWWSTNDGYAMSRDRVLHMEILGTLSDMRSDHINGDRTDNRRNNLRICTPAENSRNRKRHANTASGMKGVYFVGDFRRPWRAIIHKNYKRIHLGVFFTKEEAASAYDQAAKDLFGEFARRRAA